MAITDSLTTIAEVCGVQGHNMNAIVDAASTRAFPDTLIEYVINNVIRFVYGNSKQDIDANLKVFCVIQLSVLSLNNILAEAGYLTEWDYADPFDKEEFYKMIETKKSTVDGVDVIPLYRGQFHNVEDSL